MKPVFRTIPLVYFNLLGLFWIGENYMTTGNVNYIACVYLLLVTLQFFIKNRVLGIITGALVGLFSIFIIMGLLYYLTDEFYEGNGRLMILQLVLTGLALLMSILLVIYCIKDKSAVQNV